MIGNDAVAAAVATTTGEDDVEEEEEDDTMLRRVVALMDRGKPIETQLAAARCATYLYRCGVLREEDDVVLYKVLPCVVSANSIRV